MNNKNRYLFTLSILTLMITPSCKQEILDTTTQLQNKNEEVQITSPLNSNMNYASSRIVISCRGNCGNPGGGDGQCSMIWDLKNGLVKCGCEVNCVMEVSDNLSSSPLSGSFTKSITKAMKVFAKNFDYTTLSEIELIVDEKHSQEIVIIRYKGKSSKNIESVAYVIPYSIEVRSGNYESGGVIIEVDCNGNCDGTCVEVYIPVKGEIKCGCESPNCKMTIRQIEQ